jgi:signal transduction histidine kinase
VLVVTALLIQSVLIAALLWQRLGRRRAEREAQSLGGRLITAHEDERRRLARELHDDVTQRLAGLAIDAAKINGAESAANRQVALDIRDGLVDLSEDIHALSHQLHPSIIEDLGLVEALRAECDRVSRQETIRVDLDAGEIPKKLPPDQAICLFRVAQEALRNVIRHAGASQVDVTLQRKDGGITLGVLDNGSGFDDSRKRTRASLGLASMRERVRLQAGRIDIESSQGRGTAVFAWIPLQETS